MLPSAQALTDYMSGLSELAYAAGWMEGLEFALWRAVIDGPRRYGRLEITAEHVARLRALSTDCGGWIVFDDRSEETFVEIDAWRRIYTTRIEKMERYTT
jgi:hypothetical protein